MVLFIYCLTITWWMKITNIMRPVLLRTAYIGPMTSAWYYTRSVTEWDNAARWPYASDGTLTSLYFDRRAKSHIKTQSQLWQTRRSAAARSKLNIWIYYRHNARRADCTIDFHLLLIAAYVLRITSLVLSEEWSSGNRNRPLFFSFIDQWRWRRHESFSENI